MLPVLRYTDSDYPFGIFKLLFLLFGWLSALDDVAVFRQELEVYHPGLLINFPY